MILLDTHIWFWWVQGAPQLPPTYRAYIQAEEPQGLAGSVFSCWEIAKLVELGRLVLPCPLSLWVRQAVSYPNIHLLTLTPEIAIESTQLPGQFHRDPADQIIVATALHHDYSLVTVDRLILAYPHVRTAP